MEIVVFTNGCFDLIHQGHIDLLKKARSLGTRLIVGLNSDESVRAIKKSPRPFLEQSARAAILKELRSVDEVRIFDENTPENLIREIKPDVLVKGGDWAVGQIIGADFVLKNGGKVISIPFENDSSSSKIVEKIRSSEKFSAAAEIKEAKTANGVENTLKAYIEVSESLLKREISNIVKCAEMIFGTVSRGNKVLSCGDFESLAETENFASQLAKLFEPKGNRFSVIPRTNPNLSPETLTGDEESKDDLSMRIEKSAREGDLIIAVCNGEDSSVKNAIADAVMKARRANCLTIGLTDSKAKKLVSLCDAGISLSLSDRLRLKTAHNFIGQIWLQIIEEKIKDSINF